MNKKSKSNSHSLDGERGIDNLSQLIEQAAARSGAADEALAADRIAQQSDELDRLVKERDALLKAQGSKS